MAATAAAIAMDMLGHGLAMPDAVRGAQVRGARMRTETDRVFAQAEQEFERWRATLPASIGRLRQALCDDEDRRAETLAFLGTVIAAVSAKIDAESAETVPAEKRWRKGSDAKEASAAAWIADLAARTNALERAWRDERVRFYYALLALRAEFDPEARGGPRFDTAEGLEAFLATIEPD